MLRRWVMVRYRRLFPSTSKANSPKIITQIKHPVNCTEAAGFLFMLCLHSPSRYLTSSTSSLLWLTQLRWQHLSSASFIVPQSQRGWHTVRFTMCGGVKLSVQHNARPFVEYSHYKQQKGPSHIQASKPMPPRREQEREIYPPRAGTSESFWLLMNTVVLLWWWFWVW